MQNKIYKVKRAKAMASIFTESFNGGIIYMNVVAMKIISSNTNVFFIVIFSVYTFY
jgi:hypothetical protein